MDQIAFSSDVAIIGMSGRFPGARTMHEFWHNLCNGVESIAFFSDQELDASGVAPELYRKKEYIRAGAVLADIELFDAAFFGISPRDAALMDPQHRFLLECAWEALEDGGYDPERFQGRIGMFAGASMDTYLLSNLMSRRELVEELGMFQIGLGNEKDHLATRVSYKLNLRGPSLSISTACSTSLVATHLALQSLLARECDMALAGGVSIKVPHKSGYVYQEGGIASPDGHCRAFDEQGQGSLRGNGVGVVLLKRLSDALEDRDTIYAVIKGSAVNNDGSAKVGYTAPGIKGQADVIAEAQAMADINPEMVTYIEAHGTATPLGDPIEIAALTRAFRAGTQKKNFCMLGSVKTNIGHLDAAAGMAGLMKTVLALKHKQVPPSLHFAHPNAKIDFAHSPFYVNTQLTEWESHDVPRTAGVSSFGVGGTNAHIVLQEAPSPTGPAPEIGPWHLLLLSARTQTALAAATTNLASYLKQHADVRISDVAYVLQCGRRAFDARRAIVCRNIEDAINALDAPNSAYVLSGEAAPLQRSIVFLFPGQGAQYVQMASNLYQHEPVFRAHMDKCMDLFRPYIEADLRDILYLDTKKMEEATQKLTRTALAQPALFAIEYALAQVWIEWGITPHAFLGHSIGEYVAACLAGVFSLPDAIKLVALRGKMMQALPKGAMLAIPLSVADVQPFLHDQLSLAAINGPMRCVVSGAAEAISSLEQILAEEGVMTRTLHTSHAFHSSMMDPIVATFVDEVKKLPRKAPAIPFISNVTGTWITEAEATDPAYWGQHLRQTVQFSSGLQTLLEDPQRIFLEVGPGSMLSTLAKQHSARKEEQRILSTLPPHAQEQVSDLAYVLSTLGQLWIEGVHVDWSKFARISQQRIPLPTYPFERQRHWIEAARKRPVLAQSAPSVYASMISLQPLEEQDSNNDSTERERATMSVISMIASQEAMTTQLRELFSQMLGMKLTRADDSRSFLEIGADSLFLLQASQKIRDVFGVKIPFRMLLEEYPTVEALAAYLAQKKALQPTVEQSASYETRTALPAPEAVVSVFPQEPYPHTSAFTPQIPAENGHYPGENGADMQKNIEQIVQQQLSIMRQQLDILSSELKEAPFSQVPEKGEHKEPSAYTIANTELLLPAPNGKVQSQSQGVESETFVAYKPRHVTHLTGLTERQKQHIAALIARYVQRTQKSKQYAQQYRRFHADNRGTAGFNLTFKEVVYPLVIKHAQGARMWDTDDNEYVDLAMGFGALLFGHSPSFVVAAIEQQMKHGIGLGLQSDMVGKAAQLLCELTGGERACFCNSGTEAVMTALRLARAVTGRAKIALFTGSFHGTFDGVLVRGQESEHEGLKAVPLAPGITPHLIGDAVLLNFDRPEALDTIKAQAHELAAVLVELPQSRRPDLQPTEFLQALRRITTENGVALIFDEVVSGFRSHPGGAQALFGVKADIVAYGKALGGGLPVAALAGKAEYMDAVDGGAWNYGDDSYPGAIQTFFAGTYFKHPLLMPVVYAILSHLKKSGPQLQERLSERTAALTRQLDRFFEDEHAPVSTTRFRSLFRFVFPAHYRAIDANVFYYHLLENGVNIPETRNCMLSTAHTDEDIEHIIWAVKEAFQQTRSGGFLSGPSDMPELSHQNGHSVTR